MNHASSRRSVTSSQTQIARGAQTALSLQNSARAASAAATTIGAGRLLRATIARANTWSSSGRVSARMSIPAARPVRVPTIVAIRPIAIGRGQRMPRSTAKTTPSNTTMAP
jgi:hypothetical protein